MPVKFKNLLFIGLWLVSYSLCFGKEIFITRDGYIEFFSSTPIEDIKAVNNQVSCVLNKNTGDFAFQVPIKGFAFKNALMQEHFNENYLESDVYPKSVFKGKIKNWEELELTDTAIDITIEGDLTIHGVKSTVKEPGKIWKDKDKIMGECKFEVAVADYDIKVPHIVKDNIAKIIEISVSVKLKRK